MSRKKLSKLGLSFTLAVVMLLFMVNIVSANVMIDKYNLFLTVGEKYQLKVVEKVPGNASIMWESSDPSVAQVSGYGDVVAIGEGVAVIYAINPITTAADQCRVTVFPGQPTVVLQSISLNPSSAQLKIGDTIAPHVLVLPVSADTASIVWTSSNPGVATVQNGIIRAVSEGTSIITARLMEKTASCQVEVQRELEEEKIYLQGIQLIYSETLQKITSELSVEKGELIKLNVLPQPLKANQLDGFKPIRWESSNPAAAIVDSSGTVEILSAGTATITAKTADNRHEASINLRMEESKLPAVVDQLLKTIYRSLKEAIAGESFKVLIPTATAGTRA